MTRRRMSRATAGSPPAIPASMKAAAIDRFGPPSTLTLHDKALFADRPTLALHEHTEPPIAEPHARLRQFAHPESERGQWIFPTLIVRSGSRRRHDTTRSPRTHSVPPNQVPHDLALLDGLQNLFLDHVLEHDFVERQVRDDTFEFRVLIP